MLGLTPRKFAIEQLKDETWLKITAPTEVIPELRTLDVFSRVFAGEQYGYPANAAYVVVSPLYDVDDVIPALMIWLDNQCNPIELDDIWNMEE